MFVKLLILAVAITAVVARPQPVENETANKNTDGFTIIDGVAYPEFPADRNYQVGVVYHHYGNFCELKPDKVWVCTPIDKKD